MLVDGEKYLPINTDGNSTFEIPVAALDTALAVTADTVAMSTPHEIDYTLTFDGATLAAAELGARQLLPCPLCCWQGARLHPTLPRKRTH